MSSLPLEVHEVLEDEYRTTYDKEPPAPVAYDPSQLLDVSWRAGTREMRISRARFGRSWQAASESVSQVFDDTILLGRLYVFVAIGSP
jgi:hypothetical protein